MRMRCFDGITNSMVMSLNKFWKMVKDREAWHASVHWVPKSWTWLNDWKTTKKNNIGPLLPMGIWVNWSVDSYFLINLDSYVKIATSSKKKKKKICCCIFGSCAMKDQAGNHLWSVPGRAGYTDYGIHWEIKMRGPLCSKQVKKKCHLKY